jgi:hypothetical protein
MTDHIRVDESFIDALVQNAAWDAARVSLTEGDKKGDKSKDKPEDKGDYETGARKGDKSNQKDKAGDKGDFETGARKGDKSNQKDKEGDKPDFTTDMRKGDKSKTHPGKKDFEGKESVEEHVCPLCESVLEEALTDDQIAEHVGQIQDALLSLEEESDEDDVEPTDADLDAIEKEKANEKKEAVMSKVKELKKSAAGK